MRSFKVVDAICSDKFLKGINADYSPKYYFEYNGAIYMKLKFEMAYICNFNYPRVDVVKEINNRS